jgi:hypothetical protein
MKSINISQIDTFFVDGSYPIEFLSYYKNGLHTGKIRKALHKLSSAFWPMFGEYEDGIIHFDSYAEQACFEEAVYNQDFDPLQSPEVLYETYCHTIPEDLPGLFFLKIIHYQNGTIIIPRLNHLAGDGYSYFYFLSLLATLAQDNYIPFKKLILRHLYQPHHRRTILAPFKFKEIERAVKQQTEDLTITSEEIAKTTVSGMTKDIAARLDQQVSANDVLSAIILKKTAELQKSQFGFEVQLTIPVDVRRQIQEYGPKFFGNGLLFNQVTFKTRDIIQSDTNIIAIEIRKRMPVVNKENYVAYLNTIEAHIGMKRTDKLKVYNPDTGCLVTNLTKMPVNRLDFGTGIPDFIFPLTVAKNSAAILADKDTFILRLVY